MIKILNILIHLSVVGTLILLEANIASKLFLNLLTAKWHYLNRKIALSFYLIPIFLICTLLSSSQKQDFLLTDINKGSTMPFHITNNGVKVLFGIWLVGVIVKSIWYVYVYFRMKSYIINTCKTTPVSIAGQSILDREIKKKKRKYKIKVVTLPGNISPAIFGIIQPKIILPNQDLLYDDLKMIVNHELTHYRKRDLFVKRITVLVCILHWFNPCVYVLKNEIQKWSEYSCDEEVVKEMTYKDRKKYGYTLLKLMKKASSSPLDPFFTSYFVNFQTNIGRRLLTIMNAKKVKKSTLLFSVIVGLSLFGSGLIYSVSAQSNFITVLDESFEKEETITLTNDFGEPKEEEGGYYELVSVKLSDESRFSSEDWEEILLQIENNEVLLEEE